MHAHRTIGILLAAGTGQRFDPAGQTNKLLQPMASGVPVAFCAARHMLSVWPVTVAVALASEVVDLLTDAGCEVVTPGTPGMSANAHQGMGWSLASAAHYIQSHHRQVDRIVVGLADMPCIDQRTLQRIEQALAQGADIVRPVYRGTPGHPVGFAARHLPALAALQGDRGARDLLQRFTVLEIDVEDSGVLLDIDRPADLDRLPAGA